jgi:predicted HicB family RNase H-like nuclease
MDLLKHGDFLARVEYDDDIETFHGRVVNTRNVITFYGETVADLKREFATSVEVYLEVCAEKGITPERPYSGEFRARIGPEIHSAVAGAAAIRGVSMNAFVMEALATAANEVHGVYGVRYVGASGDAGKRLAGKDVAGPLHFKGRKAGSDWAGGSVTVHGRDGKPETPKGKPKRITSRNGPKHA